MAVGFALVAIGVVAAFSRGPGATGSSVIFAGALCVAASAWRPATRVAPGDLVTECDNTGNSTEPHLHR